MAREKIVTFFLSLCNVVRLWDLISNIQTIAIDVSA